MKPAKIGGAPAWIKSLSKPYQGKDNRGINPKRGFGEPKAEVGQDAGPMDEGSADTLKDSVMGRMKRPMKTMNPIFKKR